ncbi:hypothetical protein [Nocardia cyriacigeorgica]|nr:hypothetical protein [Nocardia cyriacigeorgica]MBF6326815.1 hypothetical protein [Nocardia cyriacigeorgica]
MPTRTRFIDADTLGLLLDLARIVIGLAVFAAWFAYMIGAADWATL